MASLQKLCKLSEIPAIRLHPLFTVINLIPLLFLLTSCRENMDCTSPPPSFYFQIQKDGITYPSQKDTLKGLGIYYVTAQQTKSYVGGINLCG